MVVSVRPGASESLIRLTGLALQLLGIGTVIWGISETRALFGHPSLVTKTKGWIYRFPLICRAVTVSAIGVSSASSSGTVNAYVTHHPGVNPTTDARLDALEKNISSVNERISATQKEMGQEFRKATDALRSEEQMRQTEDNAIREKLEATGTGGVHISAIGALWLFVGVILSTAAPELEKLLK